MRETYHMAMQRAARDYFRVLLRECGGNVNRAAALAMVSITTVHTYVRRTEIKAIRAVTPESRAP